MTDSHAIVRRSRTSFYWAMRLLPVEQREAMFSLYAYCRGLDDIADGSSPSEHKRARLAVLRGVVAALYETGIALDPLVATLAPAIRRFDLPHAELEALIDGMEMDVNGPLTAPSLDTLRLYCRRVAGAVGLLAVRVFGRPDAETFALLLGEALQLTNILRDVHEDAAEGRLYLPAEALEAATILAREPAAVVAHPGLPRACRFLAEEAGRRFAEAEAELARIGGQGLWPARAMMGIYRAQLDLLVAFDWKSAGHPRVGRFQRLLIALRCAAIR
jgi:squalene synthase HpnD